MSQSIWLTSWSRVASSSASIFWERTAEAVAQHQNKGSLILVPGQVDQWTWNDRETGQNRSNIELVATDVQFLTPRQSS